MLMHCGLSQGNVHSDSMAFVCAGSFLLHPRGPAELTLTPFEACGNPRIRSDELEWVGRQEESSLSAHIFTPFSVDYNDC